ncbi:MAG: beta-ketoacyl-ACP synthase II [Rickettsiales bacterium]|jgi:3-oxoacyl-[acyl-carrier-protein] synthase II
MRRVVVTGMGVVTPLGVGVGHVWRRLLAGDCGLSSINTFDASDLSCQIAGHVPVGETAEGNYCVDDWVDRKDQRKMDPFIAFAIAAAEEAIQDSGWLPDGEEDRERTGVLIGSGIGGLPGISETSVTLHERGPRRVSPFFIPANLINLASGHVSIRHGFSGPNHSVVTACATGAHAIGDAARLIQFEDAEVMVAGGAEAAICRMGIAGFAAAKALSTGFNDNPKNASRPWDVDRDGFVMGEGAGVVVLEEYEHAKARGAKIYAEVTGYGLSGDAYHITAPASDGRGGFRAMKAALKRAGIGVEAIDYINAHGTSTPLGDEIELGAVKRLFGDHAYSLSMSSTKSAIGHLLGAAGAVEAVFSIKAIENGVVPPTLNLDNPSEGCDIDLVAKVAKERPVKNAMSNSFGFGGTNASLVLSAVD